MAVYNGAGHVRQAVESVLAQTFGEFEFVVADDASTDSTSQILASFTDPRIRSMRNERNLGVTATRNRLVRAARGELLATHDHDDVSLPERLEKEIAFLDAHPECLAVSASYVARTPDGADRVIQPPLDHLAIRWRLLFGNALPHPASMIRAGAMRAVGGYDEAFTCALDHELFCRLSRLGALANIAEPLVVRNLRPESISVSRRAEQQRLSKAINAREMGLLLGREVAPLVAERIEGALKGRVCPLRRARETMRLTVRLAESFRDAHDCPEFVAGRLAWVFREHVKFALRDVARGSFGRAASRAVAAVILATSGLLRHPLRLLSPWAQLPEARAQRPS